MDPKNRADDLIVITDRLADLLERENDALKNHRNREIHELLDEKVTLSRVYETRMQAFSEQEGEFEGIDADVRERLIRLGRKIDGLLDENARLLKVAIDANRRVVDMIAEAVREAAPSAGTYGAKGTTGASAHRAEAQGVAISIDQTL